MAKNLLIVESPAKAKTINKYLGADFQVLASYGHVRDLRPKEGAVDPEHGFAMAYEVIDRNEKHVDAIAKAARAASSIYLATDLDREGEAISWHISEILKERGLLEGKDVQRVVFSEITPKAIKEAVANPRKLSHDLVDAQQARRALDYLVGFNLSPVLWRKVQRGLSAGRVQSPALRMIVERELEIEAFKAREYWTIQAGLAHKDGAFDARLVKLHGKKFEQFDLTNEQDAMAARASLEKAAAGRFTVGEVTSRERKRRPAPPFTTSTLQQEAARKLGFSTSRTMRVAQGLYEGVALGAEGNVGLITYMRTDSVALSDDAVAELRDLIGREYGKGALPDAVQVYKSKSKNAQEAHEAVRPTSAMRIPRSVASYLNDDQRKLYELIWKRTVACQMIHATMNTVSVEFPVGDSAFRSTGTTVIDPGFLAVYEEGRDQKTDDDDDQRRLPLLKQGDVVPVSQIAADQHFTEPPPRYSEASLVKALEEYGIGRPSTYASIIQVLLSREYVLLDSRRFKPTDVGRAVSQFLSGHFTQYVDYDFTARLEDELDAVSRGEEAWVPLLERFWLPFKTLVDDKTETVDRNEATGARELGTDPKSGKPVSVRLGRYGAYAQIGSKDDEDKPTYASLRPGQSMHTITLDEAMELFKLPRTLGQSEAGEDVTVGIGRFGPFVKQGSTYASLKPEDDPYVIELPRALQLVQEKLEAIANRTILDFGNGTQVLNGRYGPYITDGEKNARIPKDRDPKTLTEAECAELLAAAPVKKPRGGRAAKKTATKKAAAKKTATTKVAAKKAPAKKAAAKKATKKTATKKAAAKKTTAKTTAVKKAAAKKTASKTASSAAE
ncbi:MULTISPECIES: DNA topoisomerase I [unclassified Luteibacter]|uniref:DNA topoisomerase I n=1 Tax=unclassified Luteibacter TaxID=2620188 RepID=UPI0008B8EAE5|nr:MULTISPECIES: DNA topoisomerase I [unclassified Luteibacter]MDR6937726.1 DNA topoisomerase-1 [Luteibacter sp. 3190]SEO39757.1 DNA topoisomerase-1 [Luteibacter sp. UNC138MFCol5.1]